jgi:trans-aconitate 2-methyltransferase
MSAPTWDPRQYRRFADERSRPFFELIDRVGADRPRRVVDLGCGTGALTTTLTERWPDAVVEGVDSSPEMIAEAAPRGIPDRLSFTLADLRSWRPRVRVDVLVSNAALQWVPDHEARLPAWVEALSPGGWLAFQVPGADRAPIRVSLDELRQSARWRDRLAGAARWPTVLEPADYVARLAGLGCQVDAWETTYLHVLQGPDPVLEWVKGTALRPVLSVLAGAEREAFLSEYGARLRDAYPCQPFGTVLPFRRLFVVARKREGEVRLREPGEVAITS